MNPPPCVPLSAVGKPLASTLAVMASKHLVNLKALAEGKGQGDLIKTIDGIMECLTELHDEIAILESKLASANASNDVFCNLAVQMNAERMRMAERMRRQEVAVEGSAPA